MNWLDDWNYGISLFTRYDNGLRSGTSASRQDYLDAVNYCKSAVEKMKQTGQAKTEQRAKMLMDIASMIFIGEGSEESCASLSVSLLLEACQILVAIPLVDPEKAIQALSMLSHCYQLLADYRRELHYRKEALSRTNAYYGDSSSEAENHRRRIKWLEERLQQ